MFFIPLVTFAGNMKLHYDRPAEYFEEALVIGNGTMGATLYGGVKKDKISFNDITLCTGENQRDREKNLCRRYFDSSILAGRKKWL